MDNEMIERVAKAIEMKRTEAHMYNSTEMAIAAIKAIREPTEKMINRGNLAIAAGLSADDVFRNMIDAVIND